MKPWIHSESSAKKFGGKPEDYIEIHNLLDSSKSALCDNRHRVLTHNSWFIGTILEKIFGVTITNSEGKKVSVRDIGEQHVSEDFKGGFVPSVQDFLVDFELKPWMTGDGLPPSLSKEKPIKIPFQENPPPNNPPPNWPPIFPHPYDGTKPTLID